METCFCSLQVDASLTQVNCWRQGRLQGATQDLTGRGRDGDLDPGRRSGVEQVDGRRTRQSLDACIGHNNNMFIIDMQRNVSQL